MRRCALMGILGLVLTAMAGCAVPLDQINGDQKTSAFVLQIQPNDAKVFLDGRYIGRAQRFDGEKGRLAVAAGGHVLRFEHEDFENETREIVTGRPPAVITVKMLPKPQPVEAEE